MPRTFSSVSSRGGMGGGVSRQSVSIQLMIPTDIDDDDSDFEEMIGDSCSVCLNEFCDDDACCRTSIPTKCCSFESGNALCAKCTSKLAQRCHCKEGCDAVVASCPLCRSYNGVNVMTLYLGSRPLCKKCKANDEEDVQ